MAIALLTALLAWGVATAPATLAAGASAFPASAPAEAASPETTLAPVGDPNPGIIPAPNSGTAPSDAGERGGWMQSALFVLLCGAIILMGLLVWRESRRKRRAAAAAGAAPGGRPGTPG